MARRPRPRSRRSATRDPPPTRTGRRCGSEASPRSGRRRASVDRADHHRELVARHQAHDHEAGDRSRQRAARASTAAGACRWRGARAARSSRSSGSARITRVAGSACGLRMAITGAPRRFSPKPIDPWTSAPTRIAPRAIAYSRPDRCTAAQPRSDERASATGMEERRASERDRNGGATSERARPESSSGRRTGPYTGPVTLEPGDRVP